MMTWLMALNAMLIALTCAVVARADAPPYWPPPPQLPKSIPHGVFDTLDNRCIICHSSTWDEFGRLDLSKWVDTPDGKQGFVHLDAQGKQRPSEYTFRQILDRITTTDPDAHMPLGGDLGKGDLDEFAQWLSSQLQR
jgi:hypothetical protein